MPAPRPTQHRRADPGLGGDERNTESAAQRHTPIAHRAGPDVDNLLDRVQDRLPFGDGLASHERLEAGDQRSQFLSGIDASLVPRRDPVVLLILRPVAMAGHVDRRHREATFGHEAARTGHDAGGLLVLPTAVSHQDQRAGAYGTFRRPQHAGNLTEGKELFAGAAGRRLRDEAHSVSSLSGCLLRALPRPCEGGSPDLSQR
jgi:hypothetical protein